MINKAKDGFSDASDGSFDGPEENLNAAPEAELGLCTALYPYTGRLVGLFTSCQLLEIYCILCSLL